MSRGSLKILNFGGCFSLQGTKTTGEQVTIKGRICFPPDVSFFPVKSMKAVEVRFKANANEFVGNGVIAGYATYKEGTVKKVIFFCYLTQC